MRGLLLVVALGLFGSGCERVFETEAQRAERNERGRKRLCTKKCMFKAMREVPPRAMCKVISRKWMEKIEQRKAETILPQECVEYEDNSSIPGATDECEAQCGS